ncbi:MAG: diguanylate cyclase [Sulfurospirillaceae bacterium]|nr:diguanylate cyclase [Sulfurospirillaceae bacterium]
MNQKHDYSELKNVTILVVEDDEDELEELCSLLEIYCKECYKARDGEEGLAQFMIHQPDIVLVDLGLPKMDGFSLIRKMREINEDISVVLHTVFASIDTFLQAIGDKISGYVIKPTNAKLLLDVLLKESKAVIKDKEFKKEKILTQAILNEFPYPMVVIDLECNISFVNNLAKKLNFIGEREFIKCYDKSENNDIVCKFTGNFCKREVSLANGASRRELYEDTDKNGKTTYLDIKTIPMKNENNEIYAFLKIIQDKTVDKEREAELQYMANYDMLTKLPNRILLKDRLEQAILRSKRSQKNFAILFIDLDKFKEVNDTFGHNAGDQLLQMVADRIKTTIRQTDTLARFGGDEFVLILESASSKEQYILIAKSILEKLSMPFTLDHSTQVRIACSIGIEICNEHSECSSEASLIHNADKAMYEAKRSGKNRYKFLKE